MILIDRKLTFLLNVLKNIIYEQIIFNHFNIFFYNNYKYNIFIY